MVTLGDYEALKKVQSETMLHLIDYVCIIK